MNKDRFSKNFFTKAFEIREDVADCSIPRTELIGNTELTVSGVQGIVEYGSERIRLNTGKLPITVVGRDMTIKSYNTEELCINGFIERLEFAL